MVSVQIQRNIISCKLSIFPRSPKSCQCQTPHRAALLASGTSSYIKVLWTSAFTENNLTFNLSLQDVFPREPCCKVPPYVTLKLLLTGAPARAPVPGCSPLTHCLIPQSFICPSSKEFWLYVCCPWVPGVVMADTCPDLACIGQEGAQSFLLWLCVESQWSL